jgi:hypothetical protein
MPGVDDPRAHPLKNGMSRPVRLLTLSLLALSLGLAGCRTSTPYTRMYSPRKTHWVAPPEKSGKTAEELLKGTETPPLTDPTAPPPADPNAVPGLPPAGLPIPPPAVDPLAPPPAA